MYFFIRWGGGGGGLPKNYSDEVGGHAKKIGNWGGVIQFSNYTPPNPTSPPYPIKNERSLRKTVLKTQLSPFFFRVPCAMITAQSSVADPVCYVSFLVS